MAIGQAPVKRKAQRITLGRPVDRRQAMLIAGGAGVALGGGAALLVFRNDWFGPETVARRICCAAFKNLSGGSGQAYLSEGLTEEVPLAQ